MALNQLLFVLPLVGLAVTLPPDPFGSFSSSFDKNWFEHRLHRDSLKHGTEPIPSIVKRLPIEDKSFKKPLLLDNTPYCQEISSKDSKTRCYKCKDPSNGMNYEHCSYSSERGHNSRPRVRGSRSNKLEGITSLDSASAAATHSERQPTYRFGDDYFQPETTSSELEPSASSSDGCKRERRDSMLCMVCRDPKTNGKYEQCSYVGAPSKHTPHHRHHQQKPKARRNHETRDEHHRQPPRSGKQQKSDNRDKLHTYGNEELDPVEISREDDDEQQHDKDDKEGHGTQHSTYVGYPKLAGYEGVDDDDDAAEESPQLDKFKSPSSSEKGCRNVKRNGESCIVCTDPKSGAKSEKCNYSFEPKDKAYAYTKSKSFGYPESNSSPKIYKANSERHEDEEVEDDDEEEEASEQPEKLENSSGSGSAEDYSSSYASPDYIRSESERISKKVASKGEHCREEKRDDGMICQVCKDPRTGDDFERCNYSYEPDDKVYAYSKSKHFGSASPSSQEEYSAGSESASEEESSQPAEESSYSTSVLDYLPKPSASQHSNVYSSYTPPSLDKDDERDHGGDSRVDSGFHDASLRRAEIEKIVEEMGAHDRSKCSKSQRNGMTCYRCQDEKGFSDEECVFVTEPDAASAAADAAVVHVTGRPTATTTTTTTTTTTAGSQNVTRSRRSSSSGETKKTEDSDERVPLLDEEIHEAEPYDYVAETRPVYDKVLGLSLPAYMVKPSPQEMDFDLSVENSKF